MRKNLVPQATIPVLPLDFHSHTPTSASAPFFISHPSCLFLLSHTLGPVQSQLCLPSPCLLSLLSHTGQQFPLLYLYSSKDSHLLSLPPTPPHTLSSSFPPLLALPSSPGPSWGSCTQPPPLCMQSCQLSFRLQWQELLEDKGKVTPGTAHCCNEKRLNTQSNQLSPQSPKIKSIQLSGHQNYLKEQNMLHGHRIYRTPEQCAQTYLGLQLLPKCLLPRSPNLQLVRRLNTFVNPELSH